MSFYYEIVHQKYQDIKKKERKKKVKGKTKLLCLSINIVE